MVVQQEIELLDDAILDHLINPLPHGGIADVELLGDGLVGFPSVPAERTDDSKIEPIYRHLIRLPVRK